MSDQSTDKPDYTAQGFGQRLQYVCELDGLLPGQLATLCEVTERTAKRWLRGQSKPRWPDRALEMGMRLNVSVAWLFMGIELAPKRFRLIQLYESLNTWEQRQFQRLNLRLLNNCPKAGRLLKMAAAGQISRTQLFQAM